MVTIPRHHYCVVESPVCRDKHGGLVKGAHGDIKLKLGDTETRLSQDPFPLYPGEVLKQTVTKLPVVNEYSAFKICAVCDFFDENGAKRSAGDQWLFHGKAYKENRSFLLECCSNQVLEPFVMTFCNCLPKGRIQQLVEPAVMKLKRKAVVWIGSANIREESVSPICYIIASVGLVLFFLLVPSDNELMVFIVAEILLVGWMFIKFFWDKLVKRRNILQPISSTFIPRKECKLVCTVKPVTFGSDQGVRLRAKRDLVDRSGTQRMTGEEWLVTWRDPWVRQYRVYLPGPHEQVVGIANAYTLSPIHKNGLHLRAVKTFKDQFGVWRKCGSEWVITAEHTPYYLPGVCEEVVQTVKAVSLNSRQYCVVLDPVDRNGVPQLGKRKLIKGETSFFLQPGEHLQYGVEDVFVLGEHQGLVLQATKDFMDDKKLRKAGDRWLLRGPEEYIPPLEVEVVTKRTAIPLHESEGVYVRNLKTGQVRAVVGTTYMLDEHEELWEKQLHPMVEALLMLEDSSLSRGTRSGRDKSRVVSLTVDSNEAVQVYKFRESEARVVVGPAEVILGPEEQFTRLCLSGGIPKQAGVIHSLKLMLGPDSFSDLIVVETADHVRVSVQLAYNWHFDQADVSNQGRIRLFNVPDFIGNACQAMACHIRAAVAQISFDNFHKNSVHIIQSSVFLRDKNTGRSGDRYKFSENNLVITSIDVQSMEPVDQSICDALHKSVQQAIEISTSSQEAAARYEADCLEQKETAYVQKLMIKDKVKTEKARHKLKTLQVANTALKMVGRAVAEAQSLAEWDRIEGAAAVEQAKMRAEALKIEADSELEQLTNARRAQLNYLAARNQLAVDKARKKAELEVKRFKKKMSSVGPENVLSIVTAESKHQVRLLKCLGLESTVISGQSCPVSVVNTPDGLVVGRSASQVDEGFGNEDIEDDVYSNVYN
ncbi:major vault protein isoform X2 [Aplysia californica]|nr:major vault protein isoform X2 [Aplysia californica]XP_005108621.1 major vault protein isoform X2 [Aplysia californica]XP_035828356.1 major vault protein isoform X2 [Aplysia californica]